MTSEASGSHAAYAQLEQKMKALADLDGDVYLPNMLPDSPANFVFICMEPSLGTWAGRDGSKAQKMLDLGFKNMAWSMEDFILHDSIQRFLLGPGQTYYITDVSKGAMTIDAANVDRDERYARWYPLLLEELTLLAAPNAMFFSVGRAVTQCLQQLGFPFALHEILHFSRQAAKSRTKSVLGREQEFDAFASSISADDIRATAEDRLDQSGMSPTLVQKIIAQLTRSGSLSESRKMLAFTYKTQFENTLSNARH